MNKKSLLNKICTLRIRLWRREESAIERIQLLAIKYEGKYSISKNKKLIEIVFQKKKAAFSMLVKLRHIFQIRAILYQMEFKKDINENLK